jgi:hypothetical protein
MNTTIEHHILPIDNGVRETQSVISRNNQRRFETVNIP